MSQVPAKRAVLALLERAGLEISAAAKVVEAAAASRPIDWEKLFPGAGSFGLTDTSCLGSNTSCRANESCG
jgi:hypothetical protein